jgi:hypothetical protein
VDDPRHRRKQLGWAANRICNGIGNDKTHYRQRSLTLPLGVARPAMPVRRKVASNSASRSTAQQSASAFSCGLSHSHLSVISHSISLIGITHRDQAVICRVRPARRGAHCCSVGEAARRDRRRAGVLNNPPFQVKIA